MGTGFGFDAFGTTVAGFPAPTAITAPVDPLLPDGTQGCESSVEIDPSTGDYLYDDYGNEKGMDDVSQRVLLCMHTRRNSRIGFPDFGFAPPPLANSGTLQQDVEVAVRAALAPVLSDGSASVIKVDAVQDGTGVAAVITWRNNTTRQERTQAFPLRK